MPFRPARLIAIGLLLALVSTSLLAADGRITGRVTRENGSAVAGVVVQVIEISRATITDTNGEYTIDRVPPGSYTVHFIAGDQVVVENNVAVASDQPTRLNKQTDWQMRAAETITVTSASRRTERVVEAPAAVTVASEESIAAAAPTGQAPKIIESAPGVDFTQSGLYDFNFNTRGFNSSLNRRILTLIDGRDPSVPFLGAQEWAALSYPIDEMASVELVRGPGSALYGPNAFSGVLNMTTKQPRVSPGGRVQLTGGDLSTRRADIRHAGGFGNELYYRVVGGYQQTDDWTRSRNLGGEYTDSAGNTPPREAVPLALTEDRIAFGGLRLDKHFAESVLTLEGGYATLEGPTFITGIGRVQVTDVAHPWGRVNFNMPHLNFLAYYDARIADNQVALASGAGALPGRPGLYEDSWNITGEVQTNWELGDRFRVIGGVGYKTQEVDTADPNGNQTLMAQAHEEDQQSVFGQGEVDILSNLRLVVAARWDDSTLHEPQTSPKAALVYEFIPNHSVRYGYNEAFQRPNYSELFLRAAAAPPVTALAGIENALRPLLGGVQLGYGSIPVLALGNENLDVEKVRSHEIGYQGIIGGRFYMTLDYYQSQLSDFVTDLLPRVNPAYPAYAPPSTLPAPVQAQILGLLRQNLPAQNFAMLTNLPGGAPAFVLSYANAGEVDTQGVEFGANYYVTNSWIVDFNYTWFDFEVKEQQLGDVLLPNSPEHKYNVGLGYRGRRFDAKASYRWVDEFPWATGVFRGIVEQYSVVNLGGNFRLTDNVAIGAEISNLLDEEHWEAFGGDILGRRALGFVTLKW
ncbi:MAG TPA: TonB-dependent receptor [Thermoanaerobaculia bacterium]